MYLEIIRSGLSPESLRGIRFYKGHKDTAEKASIPLKMYFISLAILEKASTFLKKSSKIIEIFLKFLQKASLSL
jgi:hypothetical protein